MSADTTHSADHNEHGHDDGAVHAHIEPLALYLAVFGGLIFMTIVTVAASYVDFGAANTAIAVLIASVKASLVAIFFMHLRHDKVFNSLILLSGLLFLSFLFIFAMADTSTRNEVDDANGKPVVKEMPAQTSTAPTKH